MREFFRVGGVVILAVYLVIFFLDGQHETEAEAWAELRAEVVEYTDEGVHLDNGLSQYFFTEEDGKEFYQYEIGDTVYVTITEDFKVISVEQVGEDEWK